MSLTVSTSCPTCGGAVEFEEGTNAVRCRYCGSDHVVTGRGRVLSYYVPEKVPVWEAVNRAHAALAGTGRRGMKTRDATLFFVPFFHFLGQALRWEVRGDEEHKKPGIEGITVSRTHISVTVSGSRGMETHAAPLPDGAFNEGLGESLLKALKGDGMPRLYQRKFDPVSRHIDRSLPALDIPELKVPSLGVRPEALKLSVFEHGAASARGRIVPVKYRIEDKEEEGYAPVFRDNLVARAVFGRVRSVIFFPFWLVEVAREGGDAAAFSVVDAVSGEVTNPLAHTDIIDKLVAHDGLKFDVAGLRPLKCPNCGNGLPVKPKDVVFVCDTCRKAWMIEGDRFNEIKCSVAASPKKGIGEPVFFPFWVVTARIATPERVVETKYDLGRLMPGVRVPTEADKYVPLRFFVPAFRMGNTGALSRLSANFTRFQPAWDKDYSLSLSARGCYISREDALTLIPLILFALAPKDNVHLVRFALEAEVTHLGTELVLFPFHPGRLDYVDAHLGQSLQMTAVKD